MLRAILTFINEKELIKTNEKVLLAVSGGVDSMVLADLFLKAKIDFGMAHCNFGLRGEDADGDENFVKEFAQQHQIEFHSIKFKTKEYAKEHQVSTQMAARELRYAWFDEIMQKHDYQLLATAHHLNDNIETLLLNLVKGTGIAGLRGIEAKNKQIIRPLLFATRAEIEKYALENEIKWREDISNQSDDYQRNLLRNKVIPLLKEINPNLENTFSRNFKRFEAINEVFQSAMESFKKNYVRFEGNKILVQIDSSQNAYLEEFLKPYKFNFQQVEQIKASFLSHSGKTFISPTHQAIKDREKLIISPIQKADFNENSSYLIDENTSEICLDDFSLKFETISIENPIAIQELKNPDFAFLDFDKLVFPLEIRKWQQGDWFVPFGMKGKKKISDYLVDTKTSLDIKKITFLLISNQSIAWLVGKRIDERFRISSSTKRYIKISKQLHN